jgi:hypothetical protein
VCPNTNIQRATGTPAFLSTVFPRIFPGFQLAGTATPLRIRVYDDDEDLLRDVSSTCNCLTIKKVTDIDLVYSSVVEAPDGTYTEVEGGTQSATPAVCSTTAIEPLATPTPPTMNSGNPCPCGTPVGGTFGAGGPCTGQFQQTTPAVAGGGPFSFVAYRSITTPGFDVFGRTANSSLCHIRGNATDSCTATLGR